MEKKMVCASACMLVVVGCLHIALAEEKSNYVRSTRSLGHLTDHLHLSHKKVFHTAVKPPIEIKPSHLVHVTQEFPVWKIHKYSGIQIKPVSSIPYIHVVESKPDKSTFNLPIKHIQNLLGTTTESETILTLKELASSEEGLKLMANYIKSEYPQSDISEADIVSTISQYKVKKPSPSHQIYGSPLPVQKFGPQQVYGSPTVSVEKIPPLPHQLYGLPPQPQPPIPHPHHPLALKKFSPIQILKSALPQSFFHLLTPKNEIPTKPSISQHIPPPPQKLGYDTKYSQPLITYELPQPPKEYGPPQQQPSKVYQQQQQNIFTPSQPRQPQALRWYRIPQSQPLKEYAPHQPQPPTEYGSPKPQLIKEYGPPQPQPPKLYGPPQPQPPKVYGPPQPQPPKVYGPPQPQPPKVYGPPQPQPPRVYGPPQLQPPKVYGPPQPQPPKEYGPPQPQPPKEYGPPQPQPPKEYGQPQLQPPKVYFQYPPQPPKEYGPPQPQPIKEYGVPQLQSTKVYEQNQAIPPKVYGPPQPTKLNDMESNLGEVYNAPEMKDSSFIVKAEPIVVIDSTNTADIMKEIALMLAYGPPSTELPSVEEVDSQDDKVENVINSEEEQEDSNSKVETPKESYGPPKPYAPPDELPKPSVSEKTDEQGERSKNEQNEYLTIPHENSDSTSEFLPQTQEPEDKYVPPQIVYGNPKPYTVSNIETPNDSYGPPKPYAPPAELPKPLVSEKTDELGERSENEQNEYLTIPHENSDATSEFLPQTKQLDDKYGPPQIVYGNPKANTMTKVESPKDSYGPPKPYAPPAELPKPLVSEKTDELGERSENEQNEYLTIPRENGDATSEFLPQTKEPEDKYGPPQIVYGNPKPNTMIKEDSKDLQSNANGELLIPPEESNDSSFEFRPQQPNNEPAQTYGPPQSFYVIPKPYSTVKEDAEEIQTNKQNDVLSSPKVSSDSLSNYRPFEKYGVPDETFSSKHVSEKPNYYTNSYPGYEPTTVGTSEAQKIHSTTSSSQNIPGVIPMSMAASGLKWTDFETGIQSLNGDDEAIQPEKLITNVWGGSPELHLPSAKYQTQQSSFVPTYEPTKYMIAVQQDFYNTNIKPASSGVVKVTQKKINTNGRDVTALKYDHPNFSYTQLGKIPSDVISSSSYTRISEIPLENNVNFQNAPDQVSSYGQPLSSYIFGEDSLPAASEKKISAVVPEYRKKSENGMKPSQDKSPEGITTGRKPGGKINRDKPTRRRWMPTSKRKEENQGTTIVYAESSKQTA